VLLLIAFSVSGCKGFGTPDYTLTVILEDGCTGTPEAGIYKMDELEQLDYEYFPPEEGIEIEVLINTSSRSRSGSLVMYNNVTLTVRIIDVRGSWNFSYTLNDGTDAEMIITFSGSSPFAGTFTDSRGYNGTWMVESNSFTMTYTDWADYVFTGTLSSMTGSYVGEGVSLGWTASRID